MRKGVHGRGKGCRGGWKGGRRGKKEIKGEGGGSGDGLVEWGGAGEQKGEGEP